MINYFQLLQPDTPFALIIVTQTWSSAPRPVGSAMIVTKDQKIYGSVSGGCVEKEVIEEAMASIQSNHIRILHFGISQETAWQSGLSCGGSIELLVIPSSAFHNIPIHSINLSGTILLLPMASGLPVEYIEDPNSAPPTLVQIYQKRRHTVIQHQNNPYFALLLPPKSKLYIIGAVHVAAELVFLANHFDFETHIIDPRSFFIKNTDFTSPPIKFSTEWPETFFKHLNPGPYDYAVFLSHDPKIDEPGLEILLNSNIAYIGILGGKKSIEKRNNRLLEKGFSASDISKIKAPVGLRIHSSSAKEIALSILAEIIAVKNEPL
jgi:xanthine dehydrogenase accessory factor